MHIIHDQDIIVITNDAYLVVSLQMYNIVEFSDDNSVDFISNCWIIGRTQCFFPNVKASTLKKWKVTMRDPDERDTKLWDKFSVRILGSADSFELAIEKVKRAELTSDLSDVDHRVTSTPKRFILEQTSFSRPAPIPRQMSFTSEESADPDNMAPLPAIEDEQQSLPQSSLPGNTYEVVDLDFMVPLPAIKADQQSITRPVLSGNSLNASGISDIRRGGNMNLQNSRISTALKSGCLEKITASLTASGIDPESNKGKTRFGY